MTSVYTVSNPACVGAFRKRCHSIVWLAGSARARSGAKTAPANRAANDRIAPAPKVLERRRNGERARLCTLTITELIIQPRFSVHLLSARAARRQLFRSIQIAGVRLQWRIPPEAEFYNRRLRNLAIKPRTYKAIGSERRPADAANEASWVTEATGTCGRTFNEAQIVRLKLR